MLGHARTPEAFAEMSSYLLWKANDVLRIEDAEFNAPVEQELQSDELIKAVRGGYIIKCTSDVGRAISCFGYRLKKIVVEKKDIFRLEPPFRDFEFFLRMGYIRDQITRPIRQTNSANQYHGAKLSMLTAARYLVHELENMTEWVEEPFPRIVLKFPGGDFHEQVIENTTYVEEIAYWDVLVNDYFLDDPEAVVLEDGFTLKDLMRTWKIIAFNAMLNASAIADYLERKGKLSLNSLVRVFNYEKYIEILTLFGVDRHQAQVFISLLSWKMKDGGFCDLQYFPIAPIFAPL
jgi:hypothetical protein